MDKRSRSSLRDEVPIIGPCHGKDDRRVAFAGGARGGRSSRVLKRAKPLDPEDDYYYDDPVDERNNPTNEAPAVPPGFLSPSVREYLDLGKSIPGM